jgi:hypothetical protein
MNTCLKKNWMLHITYEFVVKKFYRAADSYLTGQESPFLYNYKHKEGNVIIIDSVNYSRHR